MISQFKISWHCLLFEIWRGEVNVGGWPFSHDKFQTFHDFLIKTAPRSFMVDHFPCILHLGHLYAQILSSFLYIFSSLFFHHFDIVLTYFLLKKFKRWAHHWNSLPVYIKNQKPGWNFFFLIVYQKEMRHFGDYEVNVRILQQRSIAEYSGENISNLSFILRILSNKRNDLKALLTMVMFHSTSKVYKVGR